MVSRRVFLFFRIPARSAPSKVRSVLHIHTDASPTRKVPLLLCCGSKACCPILSQAPKYVRSRSAVSNTTTSPLWRNYFSPPPPQKLPTVSNSSSSYPLTFRPVFSRHPDPIRVIQDQFRLFTSACQMIPQFGNRDLFPFGKLRFDP